MWPNGGQKTECSKLPFPTDIQDYELNIACYLKGMFRFKKERIRGAFKRVQHPNSNSSIRKEQIKTEEKK